MQIIPPPAVHSSSFPQIEIQKSKMYTTLARVCTRLCHDLNAQKPLILLVCHDVTTWSTLRRGERPPRLDFPTRKQVNGVNGSYKHRILPSFHPSILSSIILYHLFTP